MTLNEILRQIAALAEKGDDIDVKDLLLIVKPEVTEAISEDAVVSLGKVGTVLLVAANGEITKRGKVARNMGYKVVLEAVNHE